MPRLERYKPPFEAYWDGEHAVGVLKRGNSFIGVACLAAKEVVDKENFERRFGLSFKKDVQWKAASSLLEHLARSPMFKAVLVTTSEIPFKLKPDVPGKLEGRLRWAERNYLFHRERAKNLRFELEKQQEFPVFGGVYPDYLPKQLKEEEDYAKKYLELVKSLETQIREHLKNYFLIRDNLMAVALFLYVYTAPQQSMNDALNEIIARRRAAKIEASLTYFVKCVEVRDPLIVFNPEFYVMWEEAKKYYCLALTKDCAGFIADKEVALALRKMFTMALELPKEEIKEEITLPGKEVSVKRERAVLIGYPVKSVLRRKVIRRPVYFPLDTLTGHAIVFGKTRSGKSHLALIIVRGALKVGARVVVFDPHGTIANKLKPNENLEVFHTAGPADVTDELERVYNEASRWPETDKLRLLVVLDETRLLKARNLARCINELGKRGVGFLLITQYSTSIPPEIRNVGTYFIMSAMSETEIQRFKEVMLHPAAKLITRLPKATSLVYSPHWHPEPFIVKHITI